MEMVVDDRGPGRLSGTHLANGALMSMVT
jgi:hypothetical protein